MSSKEPPIITGFLVGLLAPLGELIVALAVSTGFQISQGDVATQGYLISIIVVILIIDVVRNFIIGLSHSQFALGNLIGGILGIIIFFPVLSTVSPAAAGESIFLVIVLGASYALGVYRYFRSREEDSWWLE